MNEQLPISRRTLEDVIPQDGINPDLLDMASHETPDFLTGKTGHGIDPDKTHFERTTPSVYSPTDRATEDATAQMSDKSFERFGPEPDDK